MNRKQRRSAVEPTNVNGQLTARSDFYRKELHRIVKGLFKVECPLDWEIDYILNTLTMGGYLIITNSIAGILPLKGTLKGYNYWNYPIGAVISVPVLESFEVTIGVDCQIVYLERTMFNHFYTFQKLLEIYSYKLAAADAGIDVNLMNSRVAYMAEAENKAQADAIKLAYEKVTEGDPMIVYRSGVMSSKGMNMFFNNVKQNYVADLIQDSKRTIMNEFLTLIGVNNANTDKRERLITDEVNANNIELSCNISLWKQNLERTVKRVNNLFPSINFNLTLQFDAQSLQQQADILVREEYDTTGHNGNMES